MINIENIETWGFEHALRGMRNPMNSWNKSDSIFNVHTTTGFVIGTNDLQLAQKLYKAGTEHRKFLRQIFVSMDITAPLYWWKEFDTYKVGTVANSCSTMHKIADKEFTLDDFSHEHLSDYGHYILKEVTQALNRARAQYNNFNGDTEIKKVIWWQMIQLLPTSYNQRRTVTMNYENVMTIIAQRSGHKLNEWNDFVKVLSGLPYVVEIGGFEK